MTIQKKACAFLLVFLLLLCGCQNSSALHSDVQEYMLLNSITGCTARQVGDFSELVYSVESAEISEAEMDAFISNELASQEQLMPINDRKKVQPGDFIKISYELCDAGEVISRDEDVYVKVGAGYFNENAEKALAGSEIGREIIVNTLFPSEASQPSAAPKMVQMNIIVKEIYYMKILTLTDATVQQYFGASSVAAFYEYAQEQIASQKKAAATATARKNFMRDVLSCFEFSLNEEVVLQHALGIYNGYAEMANGYGTSIEDFAQDFFAQGIDEFYDSCYKEAEQSIKEMLVAGMVAHAQGISLSENELSEYISAQGANATQLSAKELLTCRYDLIKERVLDTLIAA